MIPLALDPKHAAVAVAGNGALALRRLLSLRHGGAAEAVLFADAPIPELKAAAGPFLRPALPEPEDLTRLHAIWIVDLAPETAIRLATTARALRVLVNVEDVPCLCDFHSVAEVRRGDLLLTVSTNGAAPGLAGTIRRGLETCFGPDWEARVAQVAALRAGWREDGVPMPEAARRIAAMAEDQCWLSCPKSAASPN